MKYHNNTVVDITPVLYSDGTEQNMLLTEKSLNTQNEGFAANNQ